MVKVLIGDRDVQNNLDNLPFLNDRTNFSVITSNTGNDLIYRCKKDNPNIIMLNTNVLDMKYTEIIEQLSNFPEQFNKQNLLLVVNAKKEKLYLKNVSIIYHIFEAPLTENNVKPIITKLKNKCELPNITMSDILHILKNLGLKPYSNGGQYLAYTIFNCYYDKEALKNLMDTYKIIGSSSHVNADQIKNSIRHTVDRFNTYYYSYDEDSLYFKIFRNLKDITPKIFIESIVDYLREQKQ